MQDSPEILPDVSAPSRGGALARRETLPATLDPRAGRRRAAWQGALAVGAPGLLLVGLVPDLYGGLFPTLWAGLHALAPASMAPYLALGLLFTLPAVLALPIALLGGLVARRQARRGRDLGLAAAAGAGIATAAITLGAILFQAASPGVLILQAPLFAAAALAVGVVGVFSFAAVPSERTGKGRGKVPSLYSGLTAAGLGGPALLAGGALWAGLTWLVPWLSPRMVEVFLSTPLAEAATVAVALGGLAPLSWLLARGFRHAQPDASPRALGLGLLFPTVIPLFGLLGILITRGTFGAVHLAMLAGCLLGIVPHALAILLGLGRPSEAPRRLPESASAGSLEATSGAI